MFSGTGQDVEFVDRYDYLSYGFDVDGWDEYRYRVSTSLFPFVLVRETSNDFFVVKSWCNLVLVVSYAKSFL